MTSGKLRAAGAASLLGQPQWFFRARVILFGASLLALAPPPLVAQLVAERVDLNVRIDAPAEALYAKAKLTLRNRSERPTDTIRFIFRPPLSPRVQVRTIWDRRGELAWRADATSDDKPLVLLVALRSPLRPGKKLDIVVSYDLDVSGSMSAQAPVAVAAKSAQLRATGWYPLPPDLNPAVPRTLRLSVLLPKEWRVATPGKVKKLDNGTALASYELTLKRVEPDRWLLRAGTVLPPDELPSPAPKR